MTRLEIGIDFTTERSKKMGKDFIEKVLYKFISDSGYTFESKKDDTYYCYCNGNESKEATAYYIFISKLYRSPLIKETVNKFVGYKIDEITGRAIAEENYQKYIEKYSARAI